MHVSPPEARGYFQDFLGTHRPQPDREVWFFPPAVSVEAVAHAVRGHADLKVGVQDIYWEPKGAFTGAISAPLAAGAGAQATLIGHSERRHVFGDTDAETAKKVAAALAHGLIPVLCVGEKLDQREAGATFGVVTRQLDGALGALDDGARERVIIAYEPVWAIGTGKNATPRDAAEVHRHIRSWFGERSRNRTMILYGGSVNLKNVADLLAEPELDGVLVGGASLDAKGWGELVRTQVG
jgi:triosephosphate isomerase